MSGQIPALADEVKALRVFHDYTSALVVYLILVSGRRGAGKPSHLRFGPEPTFDVLAQVIDVFLVHAEFQIHPYSIVLGLAVGLEWGDDSFLLRRRF